MKKPPQPPNVEIWSSRPADPDTEIGDWDGIGTSIFILLLFIGVFCLAIHLLIPTTPTPEAAPLPLPADHSALLPLP